MNMEEEHELQEPQENLLRPYNAASMLGVTPETIRVWRSKGLIEAITTPGGQLRIPESEVRRLLEQGVNPNKCVDPLIIHYEDLLGDMELFTGCSFPYCPKYRKSPCEKPWGVPVTQSMTTCPLIKKEEAQDNE